MSLDYFEQKKNMTKKFLLNIIHILVLFLAIGCSREKDSEDDLKLDSINQTLWEGTLTMSEKVYNIETIFDFEETGYYVFNNEIFGFKYLKNKNMVQISGYNGDMITGAWLIVKLTQTQFILKKQPYTESKTHILTLNRIKL